MVTWLVPRVFRDAPGKWCGRCVARAACPGIGWWALAEKSCCRVRTAWNSDCAWRLKAWRSATAECGWKNISINLSSLRDCFRFGRYLLRRDSVQHVRQRHRRRLIQRVAQRIET